MKKFVVFLLFSSRYLYAPQALATEGMCPFLRGLYMARGRKTSLTIRLTAAERQTLLAWQRSTTLPAGLARRGRMILLLADGVPISHIAATVGISRRFVYKWVQRFLQEGLEGLADKPGRRHRPGSFQHDLRDQYDVDAG
jgi:biotin operon repressor